MIFFLLLFGYSFRIFVAIYCFHYFIDHRNASFVHLNGNYVRASEIDEAGAVDTMIRRARTRPHNQHFLRRHFSIEISID